MLDKQFDWVSLEQKTLEKWQKEDCFVTDMEQEGEPFCVIMPPANVTGSLHLGHALTFTIQDILVRYQRLCGKKVLWQPGTDHAGIATQIVVERQLKEEGLSRHDLGRNAFLERVWQWKEQSGGAIINQLKRLGASADWDRERFTMDPKSSEAVTRVFVELYQEGLIYKDKRLVNWDSQMQSAISDLEVTQKETTGIFYYIKYPFVENPEEGLVVATTRPETLFGDQAVAVHPDHETYQKLIGKQVKLPLTDRLIPIIGDEYSDPEKGTGAVKITPAHDFNDFDVSVRHNLEALNILTPEGLLNQEVPENYQGLTITQAREKAVAALEEQGLLVKIEEKEQTLPVSDRTGVVIEPYLTDQWFVDAKTLAKRAIQAVEDKETSFMPPNWKATYFEWMKNIHAWCISRQIWWGHQIPVWYGPDNQPFVALTVEEAQEKAAAHYGKTVSLVQDSDVLDTWFSSALWPFVTLGWPNMQDPALKTFYPTSVLVTGFDILFFWVARMMMMGCHFMKEVPFKDVYIHALIRDKQGQKMSKSKGNVLDPLEVMEKYGTDALRFTLASMASPGRDIKFSEEKVEASRNFVTKLWNASRYVMMTEARFNEEFNSQGVQHDVNKWILKETSLLVSQIAQHLDAYEINVAAQKLYHFFWTVYCDWYLELTKPLLKEDVFKQETQDTLAWILGQILHLLHPFMPYVTEVIWGHLGESGTLSVSKWPSLKKLSFTPSQEAVVWLIDAIKSVRTIKSELGIKPGQEVRLYYSEENVELSSRIKTLLPLLTGLGRILSIDFKELSSIKQQKCLQILIQNQTFYLPVEGLFDIEAEIARLTKQLEKKKKEEKGLSGRLKNKEFLEKAPASVIEEAENQLDSLKVALEKTHMAVQSLKEMMGD